MISSAELDAEQAYTDQTSRGVRRLSQVSRASPNSAEDIIFLREEM